MGILPELIDLQEEMARWRHDIHKHPDHDIHDLRTVSKIAELLRSFQFDEVLEQYGQAGVVGVLRNGVGPTIGLVACISGQNIQEVNRAIEYCSVIPDRMHALGQDGETTALLGAAKYLAQSRNFSGTVVCLFSVWDGETSGCQAMIENGLLQQFSFDLFYGIKSETAMAVGDVSLMHGVVMASVAELMIRIEGRAGHNGVPNQARNPIFAGAEIVNSLGNLVASEVDPTRPIIIGISSFNSGNTFSYVPKNAELKATVRFLDPDIEEWLPRRIESLVENIAASYNVRAFVSYRRVSPVSVNDKKATLFARQVAIQLLGESCVHDMTASTMLGWDIADFLKVVPGAIIQLGTGEHNRLMTPSYDFDDKALAVGASLLAKLASAYSRPKK